MTKAEEELISRFNRIIQMSGTGLSHFVIKIDNKKYSVDLEVNEIKE